MCPILCASGYCIMHSIVISAWSEGEQTMISMLLNAVAEGTLTFWE